MDCRKKLKAPGTTAELKGISDRAGAKLKKLQAKKRKQQAKGKKDKEGEDEDEDEDMDASDSGACLVFLVFPDECCGGLMLRRKFHGHGHSPSVWSLRATCLSFRMRSQKCAEQELQLR